MRRIFLSRGMEAIVDDEDYDALSLHKWSYANVGYAVRRADKKIIYMHRYIMGNPLGQEVDHRDNNRLNNQKNNLRICKRLQNSKSQLKRADKEYTSSNKGVHFDRRRGKWKAEITVNYKNKFLGRFDKEEDAVLAYNNAAIKHFGEFAKINI